MTVILDIRDGNFCTLANTNAAIFFCCRDGGTARNAEGNCR